MGWALLIGGRAPAKILFARDTGRVHQADFTPVYGERGTVERMEVVPFRLTRNLYAFFTQVRGGASMLQALSCRGLPLVLCACRCDICHRAMCALCRLL